MFAGDILKRKGLGLKAGHRVGQCVKKYPCYVSIKLARAEIGARPHTFDRKPCAKAAASLTD